MNKKLKKVLIPAIIFTLLIFNTIFTSNITYANDQIQVIGNEDGLEVVPDNERFFDFDNLNPGDVKNGTITIKNNYDSPFNIYMRQERIGEAEEVDLLAQLVLNISYEGRLLYEGPLKDFANDNILLGKLERNDVTELDITITLPGPETGNEFQGTTAKNQWIFTAQAEKVEGAYDENGESEGPKQSLDGQVKLPMTSSVIDYDSIPQTGEMIPYLLYGIGASAILIGIILKFKK